MGVALFAIPIGLLIGTVAVKVVLLQFVEHAKDSNVLITEAYKVVAKGEVQLYYWWIYLLAIAVTLCTVYLSLMNYAYGGEGIRNKKLCVTREAVSDRKAAGRDINF